jgi:hypothetical protein
MKRPEQPAELATAYVMLADPLSSYVSGATIAVTGGKPILFRPALTDPGWGLEIENSRVEQWSPAILTARRFPLQEAMNPTGMAGVRSQTGDDI